MITWTPPDFDTDPTTVDCPCDTCQGGGRCPEMTLWVEQYKLRHELDRKGRRWLRRYGWTD